MKCIPVTGVIGKRAVLRAVPRGNVILDERAGVTVSTICYHTSSVTGNEAYPVSKTYGLVDTNTDTDAFGHL